MTLLLPQLLVVMLGRHQIMIQVLGLLPFMEGLDRFPDFWLPYEQALTVMRVLRTVLVSGRTLFPSLLSAYQVDKKMLKINEKLKAS